MKLKHLFENEVPNPNNTNPCDAYFYAKNQGKRIPELEHIIMKDPYYAYRYALNVIKGKWPEAEPYIKKHPQLAYLYALDIIKGRWPEAEPFIMKDLMLSHSYAKNIIKGRWPEAEPFIMKDPMLSLSYAKNIIKGRWPEGEKSISKKALSSYLYALDIIKGRWPEGEKSISEDTNLYNKYSIFLSSLGVDIESKQQHNNLVLTTQSKQYVITDIPNTISDSQFLKLLKISFPNISSHEIQKVFNVYRKSTTTLTWKEFIKKNPLRISSQKNRLGDFK